MLRKESPCQLPVMALRYVRPSDGLPLLQDWISNSLDIFSNGFESARETIEIKPAGESWPVSALEFGGAVVCKGLGKTSIVFFGLLWTYIRLRENLSEVETQDFRRLGWKGRLSGILKWKGSKVMVRVGTSSPTICFSYIARVGGIIIL